MKKALDFFFLQAQSMSNAGNYEQAVSKAKRARLVALAAIVLGIIINTSVVVILVNMTD